MSEWTAEGKTIVKGLRRVLTVHGTEKETQAIADMYDLVYWLVNGDPRQSAGATLKSVTGQAKLLLRRLP